MNDEQPATELRQKKSPRRATRKKPDAVAPDAVLSLSWRLDELPSSQHKAGLASLALCVRFLARNPDRKGICRIEHLDARGLTLAVDCAGMQSLFDDVYDASMEEQEQSKKRQKGKGDQKQEVAPKRTEHREETDPRTQKVKVRELFIYDQVVPRGAFIEDLDAGADGKKLWLKLWRDLVWSTLRRRHTTKEPYRNRAYGRPSTDGTNAWQALARMPLQSAGMSSTWALGVEAASSDNVPFKETEKLRFLLHFWPFVASVYVPAVTSRDAKRDFAGFAVAIPDVSDLESFVEDWPALARERRSESSGDRPRDAVIDLAREAGLDLLRRCSEIVALRQGSARVGEWLLAVDVFHIEEEGNNVRLRSFSRVDPERRMLDEYTRVRGSYRSHLFRHQRIANVLARKPWWWGFARLCSVNPKGWMIGSKDRSEHEKKLAAHFQRDCKVALTEVEMKQDAGESEQTLEHLIYQRVQAYVLGKTERKYDLSWSTAQGNPAKEKDYREKKEKVGREAFLAVRSRTGRDFVDYFTATICSVPHRASEEKYLEVARALMNPKEVERVRSLTLLALSAVG